MSFFILTAWIGFGCVPKYYPEQETPKTVDTGKPIVERAENVMARLRGQYVFATALMDSAQTDLRTMESRPEGISSGQVRLRALQKASRNCWDEPVMSPGRSVIKPYQFAQLAEGFSRPNGRQNLPLVRANLKAMVNQLSPCSGPDVDKARAHPRKSTPQSEQWVEDTLQRLHRLRVLANEVPGYWERALNDAENAASEISVLRAKLQKERSNPNADQSSLELHIQNMTILLSQTLPSLVSRIDTASESMETELIVLMESVETLLDRSPFLGVTR